MPRLASWTAALLIGSALAGPPVLAQTAAPAAATPVPAGAVVQVAPAARVRSITVTGNERLEPETVRSYIELKPGDPYNREILDKAIKDLYASELFADAIIRDDNGALTIQVKENPVINRILVEGAKRIKEEKVREEIRLAPRQIFTRSKARADVGRIIEIYRRSGRFAAAIEPKIVQLDQNRVDVVFEINEGPKSKVRQINILGNVKFSDQNLRKSMYTKQSRWFRLFTSADTYDPDRLAADQQKLRQFYLTQGYADFRVVSAVAELTPDRRDFIITYVVEEGDRYKFGDVNLESQIRDIKADDFRKLIKINKGEWYNAQKVETTIDSLTETAGVLGYAFADIRPNFNRDKDKREMNVNFSIHEAPRVYVEKITINGNTRTKDHVVRREFRLGEGDAFNSIKVKRSRDRVQSLGFFQEKLEIKQSQGSGPDKINLGLDVEEKPTGQLQLSAGYSSLEGAIVSASIENRNLLGKAQTLSLSGSLSSYSKSIQAGFTEPYLFDKNLALGADIFLRDLNSFRYGTTINDRQTTYRQTTYGTQFRVGFPITEFLSGQARYGISHDKITLDKSTFFSLQPDPASPTGTSLQCDSNLAGRYLCDSLGQYVTSSVGFTLAYDNLDNRLRPTRGNRASINEDVAGLGGDVRYIRTRIAYDRYINLGRGFVLNLGIEGGNITPFGASQAQNSDSDQIRLTDRFFLGEPQVRGFDIRGLGPRVVRVPYLPDPTKTDALGNVTGVLGLSTDKKTFTDEAIGGRNYYRGRAEIEVPLGSAGRELGLRPSIFTDFGALWHVKAPITQDRPIISTTVLGYKKNADGTLFTDPKTGALVLDPTQNTTSTSTGYREFFEGDSIKPRLSVGFGVNWNSPFGPFRIDIAKAILKQKGDNTQIFQFNVGTAF